MIQLMVMVDLILFSLINDDAFTGVAGDGVGNATGATIGANVTNVEKITCY